MKWKKFSRLSEQPTTVVPETRHQGQLAFWEKRDGGGERHQREREYQSEVKNRKELEKWNGESLRPCVLI